VDAAPRSPHCAGLALVAGSMTDPPALAFGNTLLGGDAAHTTYATVYPLTMLLRIFAAQLLALFVGGG
jgi:putative transport protein